MVKKQKLYKYLIPKIGFKVRGIKYKKRSRIKTNSAIDDLDSSFASKKLLSKEPKAQHTGIPRGIRVLMVYTGLVALFYMLLVFVSDVTIFFGFVLTGIAAKSVHFLFFISAIMIVFGIASKKPWAYGFSIIVYAVCILNSLASLFFINKTSDLIITSLYSLVIPIFIVTLLMNVLTIWYVYEKKPYFKNPMHVDRHSIVDLVFIYVIYIFYFFFALFLIAFAAIMFTSVSKNLSLYMEETGKLDVSDGEAYCENIANTDSRDICFVAVVYNNKNSSDINKLCSSIELGYYRYTCYKVAEK